MPVFTTGPNQPRPRRPAGPAPDDAALREAALTHLARFGTTEAGLLRVLVRRIDRWAKRASDEGADPSTDVATARAAARRVAAALAATGAVDDAAFATARVRRLGRAGRSRQAVAAHLAAKGVDPGLARSLLPDDGAELSAAILQTRRRRIGPFRTGDDADPARELAILARAGFAGGIARAALALDREAAEAAIERVRPDEA